MQKSAFSKRYKKLLRLLRELRTNANLRQVDLAEKLGEPQSFVSKYERGERRLDVVELESVCKALGVSLVDFARRFEERGR